MFILVLIQDISFYVNIIGITHRLYVRTFTAMSYANGFQVCYLPPIIIYKLHFLTLYCFSCENPTFSNDDCWNMYCSHHSSCSK